MCGTLDYLPPEMCTDGQIEYNHAIDNWSIGVLAYELCVGSPPFEDESQRMTKKKINKLDFKFPQHLSEELKDLVWKLLKIDGNERLTLDEILEHPWTRK